MGNSRAPLIRVGRDAKGSDVFLEPFASYHTLISGMTRSGKSSLVYGYLSNLSNLSNLKPLKIKLCGVDPTGVLFSAIGSSGLGGDSLRVSTLQDVDAIKEKTHLLVEEMDRRINLLLSLRRDKFDYEDFTEKFPLLLVLYEEFPGLVNSLKISDALLKPADRVLPRFLADLQRLCFEGLKVGIRIYLICQRGSVETIGSNLRSQLDQKISFRQRGDSFGMLHRLTPEQIKQGERFLPGQAFLDTPGQDLKKFRADFCSFERFSDFFKDCRGGDGAPTGCNKTVNA